jgi:hypothetical protein
MADMSAVTMAEPTAVMRAAQTAEYSAESMAGNWVAQKAAWKAG